MEFSQDKPGSSRSVDDFSPGCIAQQIASACAPAREFQEMYEAQSTRAYRDEYAYDMSRLEIDPATMPQTEHIRAELQEISTRRTVLMGKIISTTQSLINARKEIVLEYAYDPTSSRDEAALDDSMLNSLLPVPDTAPVFCSESEYYSEDNRIVDPVMAEYIAHYTNDVETALVTTQRYQCRANDWVAKLENTRLKMECEPMPRISSDSRFVAETHGRIQKVVADLATTDLMFYRWLNTGLYAERGRRFDAALFSYIVGSTAEVAAQETDNGINSLLDRCLYDNRNADPTL